MKEQEQKSLKEINNALQENAQTFPDEYQQLLQSHIEDLNALVAEQEQVQRGLRTLFAIILVIISFLCALWGFYVHYSTQLKETIDAKSEVIKRYQYQDSIYSRLLEQTDTSRYISYRIYNGKPVTYQQLSSKYDSLQIKYNALEIENADNKDVLELVHRLYPYEVIETNGKINVSGPDYKEQLRKVKLEKDSVVQLYIDVKDKYEIAKLKYELICKYYPITVGQDGNRYYVEAPKIDSALLLLPYYRDKLSYDPVNKNWSIVTIHEKVVVPQRENNKRKKK